MCNRHRVRNPLFCIVPPYVLDEIARNGSPRQRAAALQAKSVDSVLRAQRLMHAPGAPHVERPPRTPGRLRKLRTIYTAANSQDLPGSPVRIEGQGPTGDPAIDEAYAGLGATFDFFAEVFGRDSIDDEGMRLDATVHFSRDYNNAFWNSAQMVFGDGDGENFNRMTIALEVIGHELAHGITEDEARLQYFNQSGALNESLSDVFGSMIRQFTCRETAAQASWLIGEGLFTPQINGVALRSLKEPGSAFDDKVLGKDPQPRHMDQLVHTFEDNGGVHINCGIPNHAFYQIAVALGGYAWEKAGRIWYDALRDPRLKPNSGFVRFARITHDLAGRRFGSESSERRAVRDGWERVGISVDMTADIHGPA